MRKSSSCGRRGDVLVDEDAVLSEAPKDKLQIHRYAFEECSST